MRTLTLLLGVVEVLAKLVAMDVNMALMLVLHCPVGSNRCFCVCPLEVVSWSWGRYTRANKPTNLAST